MTTQTDAQASGGAGLIDDRVRPIGRELRDALLELLEAVPGAPHRPTALARRLGVSRVLVSRLLSAIDKEDPFEVLEQIPGPESLRSIVRNACDHGPSDVAASRAGDAVNRFAGLIRDDFGTRGALQAAISPRMPQLRERFEQSSRYHVYKGMRQIRGVDAQTWLTSMIFAPSKRDDDALDVTSMHGALGVRRLRPDVPVYFTFGAPQSPPDGAGPSRPPVDLEDLYINSPARLESEVTDGQLVHRLALEQLGRRSLVDMLVVGHMPGGTRRYAEPDRPKRGGAVFPDLPVKMLVFDLIVHESVYPDLNPEPFVYQIGLRGPANVNDRRHDIDRIELSETIETISPGDEQFDVPEAPNYIEMVDRVCANFGYDPSQFRAHRLRVAYPVFGCQFVQAFDAPDAP